MPQVRLDIREADGRLPMVCMCCGQRATVTKMRNMSWYPRWIILLVLINVLLAAVVAMIMTKRARLQAPLCDQHKGHWFYRGLMVWFSLLLFGMLSVAGLVLAVSLPRRPGDDYVGYACLGGAVFFVLWLVVVVVIQNSAIRPIEITDRDLMLEGVSQAFVDAVVDDDRDRHERRERRRRYDEDDEDEEDDEPRPRRRRPPSDAIEE